MGVAILRAHHDDIHGAIVHEQRSQPPTVFVKAMLMVLERETPALRQYARTKLLELVTNPVKFGTRSAFVSDVMT